MLKKATKALSIRVDSSDAEAIESIANKKGLSINQVIQHWVKMGIQMEQKWGNDMLYSLFSFEDLETPFTSLSPHQLEAILFHLLEMGSASCGYSRRLLKNVIDDEKTFDAIVDETRAAAKNFAAKFKEKIR